MGWKKEQIDLNEVNIGLQSSNTLMRDNYFLIL